jgi:hypothetical protein
MIVWIQLLSKWQFPWFGAKTSDPQKRGNLSM